MKLVFADVKPFDLHEVRAALKWVVLLLVCMAAGPALAQPVAGSVAVPNKGDTAFMMIATVLVLLMILPGLQLFYGGLARAKNMLSVMTQIGAVSALAMLIWVIYGYSFAFGPDANDTLKPFIASTGKAFLAGVTSNSTVATFSEGVVIPEYVFIAFQMTFAAITISIVLGSVVERMKFSAIMVFALVWLTIVYLPIAHMVWATGGLFFEMGALDFAGGTVVHINAGVSALVAALIVGPRLGYKRESMAPHSLTLTLVGTGLLFVGWFGFNAGSALEANGTAGLAMLNTFVATAAAALAWLLIERMLSHKPSSLGLASGIVSGLVGITPAAGNAGPFGAILLGVLASAGCYLFVSIIKPRLGLDDALDAFGIHGVGGIIGAVGTALVYAPALGGPGGADFSIGSQIVTQLLAVGVTIGWAILGTLVACGIARVLTGLRVTADIEREGLDLGEHGERAYSV